jgi:hypothetical protein
MHTKQDLELAKRPLIINKKKICLNEKYDFFIIVKSGNFQRRNLTRATWAKEITEHFNIPVLYAIGYPKNSSLQREIISEDETYKDLLQFDFLESYYNLTIKTTSVLLWYDRYCSKSSDYLLYVDDDILIHVDKLIMYMIQTKYTDTIEGWFEKSGRIQRTGIGGVTKEDFPLDIVPSYLWGAAVIYPSNVISNGLIKSIFNTTVPIFFRDDVFINAFIAEQAGIKRKHLNGIILYDRTEDDFKTNMIMFDFKTENERERVWNCYKYNIQCNKNLLLLLFKIFFQISLFLILILYSFKYFQTTKYYEHLKYHLDALYYDIKYVLGENMTLMLMMTRKYLLTVRFRKMKLRIQSLIHLRRIYRRTVSIFVIIMVLYYFVINK